MTRFAIRGLLSRKLRTALTAIAIVLGVAMISGTYVLTDSIDQAFDRIFTDIRAGLERGHQREVGVRPLGRQRRHRADLRRVPAAGGAGAAGGRRGRRQRRLGRDAAHRRRRQGGRLRRRAEPRLLDRERRLAVQPADARRGRVAGPESRSSSTRRPRPRRTSRSARRSACRPRGRSSASGLGDRPVQLGPHDRRGDARRLRPADRAAPVREGGASSTRSPIAVEARASRDGAPARRSRRSCRRTPRSRTGPSRRRRTPRSTNEFISFLQGFLLAFGGIALFVGSFVIANSLSITIAQRTREFATLRTLGATNRQVLGSVIVEALVVGIVASVVGLFLGLLLAQGPVPALRRGRLHAPEHRARVRAADDRGRARSPGSSSRSSRASIRRSARRCVPPIAAVREGATLPGEPLDRIRSTWPARW